MKSLIFLSEELPGVKHLNHHHLGTFLTAEMCFVDLQDNSFHGTCAHPQ